MLKHIFNRDKEVGRHITYVQRLASIRENTSLDIVTVGDVVEIPSTQGAADKEIGLFIEENEAKKQKKIGEILRKFNIKDEQQQEQGQNKPIAFILEKDSKKAREMKQYLENIFGKEKILLLDGSDATAYNKNKVAIEEGKYDIVIATQMLDRGVNLNEIKRDKLLIRAYIDSYSTEIQQTARVGRGSSQEYLEYLINVYSIDGIEEVAKENELDDYEYISSLKDYINKSSIIKDQHKKQIINKLNGKVVKTNRKQIGISNKYNYNVEKSDNIASYNYNPIEGETKFVTYITQDIMHNLLLSKNVKDIKTVLKGFSKMLDEQAYLRAKNKQELSSLQEIRKREIFNPQEEITKEEIKTLATEDLTNEQKRQVENKLLNNQQVLDELISSAKKTVWEEDLADQEKYADRIHAEFSIQSDNMLYSFVNADATSKIAGKLSSGLDQLKEKVKYKIVNLIYAKAGFADKKKEVVASLAPGASFGRIFTSYILKPFMLIILPLFLFGALTFIVIGGYVPAISISPILAIIVLFVVIGIFLLKKLFIDRINIGVSNKDNINIAKATKTGKLADIGKAAWSGLNKSLNSVVSGGLILGFGALVIGVLIGSPVVFVLAAFSIGVSLVSGVFLIIKNRSVLSKQKSVKQNNTAKKTTHTVTGLVVGGIGAFAAGAIIAGLPLYVPILAVVAIIGFLVVQYLIPSKQGEHFAWNLKTFGFIGLGVLIVGGFSALAFFAPSILSWIAQFVMPFMLTIMVAAFIYYVKK